MPRALHPALQLVTAILLTQRPTITYANPNPHERELAGFTFNELFARWDCSGGTACGAQGQYCCNSGQACTTNAGNTALCVAAAATVTQAPAATGGAWQYFTTTYVETNLVTRTVIWSSYVPGAAATGAVCNYALQESQCGSICCASNQYCYSPGQCAPNGSGGSSGAGYATYTEPGATAGAPIRPTTVGQTTVTATKSPTTTIPFVTPVATGASITIVGSQESNGGGGLSGGAIAGIVIGSLAGALLLALLCFCCCLKGLLGSFLACFGLGGNRKKRRTEVDEYERHSHHAGSGGGGRTWYGTSRPPARVDRRERKSSTGKQLLGIGAGLAALWAVLGLKRKRDGRRNDEKYSEYSYSSDYYTSASSASSDDRRTHGTRYSRR